jgi:cytoskeletal protein RodZ
MISKSVSVALALFTLMVFVVPSGVLQGALAQIDVDADTLIQETFDEVEQEIEQEGEQDAEQEQDQTQSNEQSADQSNTADVSQDETNDQANVLSTGDNTASTTQVGDNDAVDNKVKAQSEGGDSGDAKAKKYSKASSEGGDAGLIS